MGYNSFADIIGLSSFV